MARAGFCVAISVALMIPVAYALCRMAGPPSGDREAISGRFVEPENCRPEPSERAAFLAIVVTSPILIFGATAAVRDAGRSGRDGGKTWRRSA